MCLFCPAVSVLVDISVALILDGTLLWEGSGVFLFKHQYIRFPGSALKLLNVGL